MAGQGPSHLAKKLPPVYDFSPRYFLLSLHGTYGRSCITQAQKIDRLPQDKRELHIQRWRDRERPGPRLEEDLRARTPDNPTIWECRENRAAHRETHSHNWVTDAPGAGNSLTRVSPREQLLGLSGATGSGPDAAQQPSARSGHRRSQSSLTI